MTCSSLLPRYSFSLCRRSSYPQPSIGAARRNISVFSFFFRSLRLSARMSAASPSAPLFRCFPSFHTSCSSSSGGRPSCALPLTSTVRMRSRVCVVRNCPISLFTQGDSFVSGLSRTIRYSLCSRASSRCPARSGLLASSSLSKKIFPRVRLAYLLFGPAGLAVPFGPAAPAGLAVPAGPAAPAGLSAPFGLAPALWVRYILGIRQCSRLLWSICAASSFSGLWQ